MLKLKLLYFRHLCKELTHLKRPWCWERLKAGGEGDDRGWDGWMASPTQWTWVWVNSRSWWWTGRPGMLQSMGSQRVEHDWVTELNWTNSLIIWYVLAEGMGAPLWLAMGGGPLFFPLLIPVKVALCFYACKMPFCRLSSLELIISELHTTGRSRWGSLCKTLMLTPAQAFSHQHSAF